MRRSSIAVIALLLVSGCASVDSRHPANLADVPNGISYHLAKGLMRLKVTDTDGVLSVSVEGPVTQPDPAALLVADVPASGTADNHVVIKVDNKTNLLTSVEVTSTGRLTEIIKDALKGVMMLQGGAETTSVVLFDRLYEIEKLPRAAGEANYRIQRYFQERCASGPLDELPYRLKLEKANYSKEDEAKAVQAGILRCRGLVLAGADRAATDGGLITIELSDDGRPAADTATGQPSMSPGARPSLDKCRKGICYRPYKSRVVTLSVRGAFESSTAFLLPDSDRLGYIDLASGVFAEQKYTIEFSDGVPTKFDRDAKSEIVGLAKLPVEIVTTILSAPGEALGLRKKGLEDRNAYLDAVKASVSKQNEISEICANSPDRCPKTAYKILGGPVNAPVTAGTTERAGDADTNPNAGGEGSGGSDGVPGGEGG